MRLARLFVYISCRIKRLYLRCVYRSHLRMGEGVTFRRRFVLNIAPGTQGMVAIGDGCFFNNDCSINCHLSVSIGANTLFGEGVKVYDHNHAFSDLERPIKDQGFNSGAVRIEDNCWIGSNVVVLAGVTIGEGSVIGAGAVVAKSVPPYSVLVSKQQLVCRSRCES